MKRRAFRLFFLQLIILLSGYAILSNSSSSHQHFSSTYFLKKNQFTSLDTHSKNEDNDFSSEGHIIQKSKDYGNLPAEEIAHPIELGSEEEDDDRSEDDYHSFDAYKGEQAHSISHYDGALDFAASNSIHFSFQIPLYILFHSWRVFIA